MNGAPNATAILAHRGARLEAPENTVPAFRRAQELGADGVEFDLRSTQDGQLVLLHDATLQRTTNGRGQIARRRWSQLRGLDAGGWFGPAFAGTPLPTLQQGLQALQWARLVNVEIKGCGGCEAEILRIVAQAGMPKRVVLSSFSPLHLWRLRQLDPQADLAWLHGPGPLRWLAFPLARLLRLTGLHPHHSALSPAYLRHAHRQGRRVIAWTVNDGRMAQRLAAWGVDALITDRPRQVRDSLFEEETT